MKKFKLWFTLLDITVGIALIWIIIIWVIKLNFNSLSNKQRLDWFFYKIKTNIETVRNNTLIWKILKDSDKIIISEKWQIDFNNSGSGVIKTYYYNNNWIKKDFSNYNIIPEKHYSISTKCAKLDNSSEELLTSTWNIMIEWWNLSFTWWWSCGSTKKVLKIEVKYKEKIKKFTINTVSWVIEEQ
jgi:hypothetical protein